MSPTNRSTQTKTIPHQRPKTQNAMKRSCQPLVGLKPPLSSASCGLSTVCIALALLAVPTTEAQDLSFLTNGLVAYYPLDGDAKDHSGYGNDGTFVNVVPVADRFGQPGGAVSLNGTDSYAKLHGTRRVPCVPDG
jgi:hypothetical protein